MWVSLGTKEAPRCKKPAKAKPYSPCVTGSFIFAPHANNILMSSSEAHVTMASAKARCMLFDAISVGIVISVASSTSSRMTTYRCKPAVNATITNWLVFTFTCQRPLRIRFAFFSMSRAGHSIELSPLCLRKSSRTTRPFHLQPTKYDSLNNWNDSDCDLFSNVHWTTKFMSVISFRFMNWTQLKFVDASVRFSQNVRRQLRLCARSGRMVNQED